MFQWYKKLESKLIGFDLSKIFIVKEFFLDHIVKIPSSGNKGQNNNVKLNTSIRYFL
jgi:hypothetical protein